MSYGIIYVVENTINGKKYVGQTIQPLRARWLRHCRAKGNGCVALASAIAKYGADSFKVSVVAQASCKDELNQMEADMVVALGTVAPSGYNLRSGGGSSGKHSSGSKAKMAAAHKTPENQAKHTAQTKARWQDEQYRAKMIEFVKAFWANPDNKKKASMKMKEAASDSEVQKKKSESMKRHYENPENRERSKNMNLRPDVIAKISEASKQRWLDPDYRAKQDAFRRKHWTPEKRAEYGKKAQRFLSAHGLAARSDNTTGYRGVKLLPGGRYAARIAINKKPTHIGVYDTAEQAHDAYVEAKRQMVLNLTD